MTELKETLARLVRQSTRAIGPTVLGVFLMLPFTLTVVYLLPVSPQNSILFWLVQSIAALGAGWLVAVFLPSKDLTAEDFVREHWSRLLVVIIIVYAVAILSAFLMDEVDGTTKWIHVSRPGTLMAFTLALITVTGFAVTLTKLQEAHRTISGYDRFLLRLAHLLRHAKMKNEHLRGLCTVPTLGNISYDHIFALNVHPHWKALIESTDSPIDLICIDYRPEDGDHLAMWGQIDPHLDQGGYEGSSVKNEHRDRLLGETCLGKFYSQLGEVKQIPQHIVRKAFTQAVELINRIVQTENSGNRIGFYAWDPDNHGLEPAPHLFFTDSRAIVAMQLDRELKVTEGSEKVKLVGYETTDGAIIASLREVYDAWDASLKPFWIGDQTSDASATERIEEPTDQIE